MQRKCGLASPEKEQIHRKAHNTNANNQKSQKQKKNVLEGTDARNLVTWMDNSGRFTLRAHQDNIDHIGGRWHGANALEIVDGHDACSCEGFLSNWTFPEAGFADSLLSMVCGIALSILFFF